MAKKKTSRKAPASATSTPVRKTAAKKPAAKKAAKKPTASKKKASSKKAASKKAPQRKTAAKKATTKKASTRKATTGAGATRKKAATKKASTRKKPTTSRTPATKATPIVEATAPPIIDQVIAEEPTLPVGEPTETETPAVVESPTTVESADVEYEEVVYNEAAPAEVAAAEEAEPVAAQDPIVAEATEPSFVDTAPTRVAATLEELEHPELSEGFEGLDGLDWLDEMEPAADAKAPERTTNGSDDVLLAASEAGDTGLVRSMLDLGASPEARDRRGATLGWTPLMLATAAGSAEVVALLLAAGADADATDDPEGANADRVREMAVTMSTEQITAEGMPLGRTALHLSTAFGRLEIAKLLIQAGGSADPADHCGERPLMLAAQAGAMELAQLFMEHGVDVDGRDTRSGCGALERAAMMGRPEMIARLLERGATIDSRDAEERTPLMYAVGGAHYDAARVLLENRANPLAEATSGFGVLCAAVCARGYFPEPDGSFAVRPYPEESIVPVVELLLRWGADDSADSTGVRPSQHAEGLGHLAVVRVLFDYSGTELRKTG